ncbi:hypothetical protein D3C87_1540260 [compost metagenome]
MQAHRTRADAERVRGVWLRLLFKHHFTRDDQAFMPTPGNTQFEKFEAVGKSAHIHPFLENEGKQAGRTVEAGRQAVRQSRMANLFHHIERLQAAGNIQRRCLMRPHAQRQGAQAADQQPRIEGRHLATEIGIGLCTNAVDHRLGTGNHAGDHIAVPAEIF